MKRAILIFGSLATAILILLELNKISLWVSPVASELWIICSGLLLLLIGMLIGKLLHVDQKNTTSFQQQRSHLSKREQVVLALISEGLSNQQIAHKLFISESTVKTHVHHIFKKLKAKRRTEAVRIGQELNIV